MSPEVAAHLRRVSTTVAAYVATVCDGLRKNIPKAVVHTQVLQAKKALLAPLFAELGGVTDEQLTQLLGGAWPAKETQTRARGGYRGMTFAPWR